MRDDDVIRAFVAIEISEPVRAGLKSLQLKLKQANAKVGWVAPENIHLTVAFLGDVFGARLIRLGSLLDAVAASFAPFPFEVLGTGFFGSPESPRVLWADVREPTGALARLQEQVAAVARSLEIGVEDRPFAPHLTLGRVRARAGVGELTSRLESASNTSFGSVEVERLLLMQSHLEHHGVRYSILHESRLQGATQHGR